MTACKLSVLKTLAFFDIFDYSPTIFELWRWQLDTERIHALEDIKGAILLLEGKVISNGVIYGLAGRSLDARMHRRRLRGRYALRKNQKLLRYIRRFARFIPGIRAIAICNTRLPFLYAEQKSDIDLLVVTHKGMIWFVRMILISVLKLLHLRPGEVSQDAFDHSIFVTDEALDFSVIADVNPRYMAAWVASLDIVYGHHDMLKAIRTHNDWVRDYFPAWESFNRVDVWRVRLWPDIARLTLPLFRLLDRWARTWQQRHFTARVAGQINISTAVVVNNTMLKFHTTDKRDEYSHRYDEICSEIGVFVK